MPKQDVLSKSIYEKRRVELLARPMQPADKAWKLSCTQFNAGSWLNAIPMSRKFQCGSLVFKTMLQLRLGLPIPGADEVTKCGLCDKKPDSSFITARHCMTSCKKGHRVCSHNKLRDVVHSMYRFLGVAAEKEVEGLYSQLNQSNVYRPADVLVPPSATEEGEFEALDVTITDPTNQSNLKKHSDTRALAAAAEAHRKKMECYTKQLEAAGQGGLQFEKKPLAFETTGAMGKETQEWWKSVLKLARTDPKPKLAQSDTTWTARKFSPYYLQLISMTLARSQAESVVLWLGRSRPQSEVDLYETFTTEHV